MFSTTRMRLGVRIGLSIGVAFSLFGIAIAAAVNGILSVSDRFERFIQHDDALAQSITGAYGQGLQMGQALRNIILDPANDIAYRNLDAANEEFGRLLETGLSLAQTEPETRRVLEGIAQLRPRHQAIQQDLVKAARQNQAEAIQKLNKEETPLWREIRGHLLDLKKAKSDEVAAARASMIAYTRSMLWVIAGLGAAALALGLGVMAWLTRSIKGQLGGEPIYAAEVANRVGDGDLSRAVQVAAGDESSLIASMKRMQEGLAKIVDDVRGGADAITYAAEQLAAGNTALSERTEEQASSLEETASSTEEITSTVKQNADNAKQASELAKGASAVALKGGEMVGEVVATMSSINQSSKKIVDIIGVIDGIAFQTNILALNAAVEAARAGEQGRGFAVVASEVRSLAQRSASAAKEIKSLIESSVEKVDAGTRLVDAAGRTMQEIIASVKKVNDIMADIAIASQEQSSGINQVNTAVTQMDKVVQQNAALVAQAATDAESIKQQAVALQHAVSRFRIGTEAAGHAERRAAAIGRSAIERAAHRTLPHARAPSAVALTEPRKRDTNEEWAEF